MTTYQKLVKGATKIKMAPPKAKYVDPILLGTSEPQNFREIMHALEGRVLDTAWTIVYKSLILVHVMIREGEIDVTIKYLSKHLEFFQLKDVFHSKLSSGDLQALRRYRDYLQCRSEQYANIGKDYVRDGSANLKAPVAEEPQKALNHVESLELQVTALVKNRYSQYDLGNDLLMTAFRLLVQDLLVLYNALNEGIITLLESFFELTHQNAERTLKLYKRFVELTDVVVKYLKTGKAVGLKIPVIKHITTKLIRSLEEHLRDDVNKAQTFSADDKRTPAQRELEQIREQKKLLEQQLRSQQQMVISPTIPQQQTGYNPFSNGFTFEQTPVIVQHTSNPFMAQAPPQGASPQVAQQTGLQEVQRHSTQGLGLQYQNTQLPQQPPAGLQQQNTQFPQQSPGQGLQYQNTQFPQQSPAGLQHQNIQFPQQSPGQGLQYQNTQFQQQSPGQGLQYQNTQFPQQSPAQGLQYQHTQVPQQSPVTLQAQNTSQMPHQQPPTNPTGFYSTNAHITPNYTGAGFGGYSGPVQPPVADTQVAMPTGSKNPFSLDNVARARDERETFNPFSQANQQTGIAHASATANTNPFGQGQMQGQFQDRPHTFGGLENLPTVPVFSHTTQQQQQQQQQQHVYGQSYGPQGSQQLQYPGQPQQPYRSEGPNLIDI
ncbi:Yap1802p LALA0_S01e05710g [Lachancea lanzarotensis]|uniref:LALA0S01e05710g1_1 n=1 Tax=Lachancea lanzarotensis TaxID=1245769 RepID=A0A0C7MKA1_9SACH|nr:uncharacterized protein LALA0_S01e05710g [Lachancea lanzarotensis]CEP60218.1 LALA0S01e05710g1_1 [Lachancea lanzarotensis]